MSVTPTDFATKLLQELNIPVSKNAINTLLAWMAIEGGHPFNPRSPYTYNPLNTTRAMPGASSPGGPAGVKAYKDWAQGLEATRQTLALGFYKSIRDSLAAGNPPPVTLKLPAMATWGTNPANWNPDAQWAALAAKYQEVETPGFLSFPWGYVASAGAGAALGTIVPGVGTLIGAGLGIVGYGAFSLVRKLV